MAVRPGDKFVYGDLGTMLTMANDRTSSQLNLANFWNVSPMYGPDGNGNPCYGNRQAGTFSVTTRGSGYKLGDAVAAIGATFEVVALDAAAGISGLLELTSAPAYGPPAPPTPLTTGWDAGNDPISPCALTGGSGSGAQVTFSIARNGPNANYVMADYYLGEGNFTGFYLINGGSRYVVGDVLLLPNTLVTSGAAIPAQVSAVDGSGKITAFTLPDTSFTSVAFQALPAMPFTATGGAGTGAVFGGIFTLYGRPDWLTELNRLRSNIAALFGQYSIGYVTDWSVSGPWPISGPDPSYKYQTFYFPDTGSTVDLTITSNFPGNFTGGKFSVYYPNYVQYTTWNFSGFPYPSQNSSGSTVTQVVNQIQAPPAPAVSGIALFFASEYEVTMIIGGNQAVLVQGGFSITGNCYWGAQGSYRSDAANPGSDYNNNTPVAGGPFGPQVSGNFPGVPSVNFGPNTGYSMYPGSQASYSNTVEVAFVINEMVAPGRYTLKITCPNPGDDWVKQDTTSTPANTVYSGSWFINPRLDFTNRSFLSGALDAGPGPATASLTINSGAVLASGIHNSLNVFKIPLGCDSNGINAIAGMVANIFVPVQQTADPTPSNKGCYWEVVEQPKFYPAFDQMIGWSLSALPPGFWAGVIPSVSCLNIAGSALMPWNLMRTKYSLAGSVMVNPSLLADLAPTIAASNSYDQTKTVEQQLEPPLWQHGTYFTLGFTILDSNGNFQQVTTAGTSAGSEPAWEAKVGFITPDGSIGGLVWTCVYVLKATEAIIPAQHRVPDIPKYPNYWLSETIAKLMPPTAGSGLTIWGAYDQWYSVNKNGMSGSGGFARPTYDPGWSDQNLPYGWWIYSISLNRCQYPTKTRGPVSSSQFGWGDAGAPGMGDEGQSGAGMGGAGTGSAAGPIVDNSEISVTIGCMRNGSFVAFGTYQTGGTYQVLWPIFTSDALAYEASERIDLQAVAIAYNNTVAMGATAIKPMCAAFITDTIALLGLIT